MELPETISPAGTPVTLIRVNQGAISAGNDVLATEEPLEIRLTYFKGSAKVSKSISITMRTPGNDRELAAGFLFTEGILRSAEDIEEITPGGSASTGKGQPIHIVICSRVPVDLQKLERHFYTTSSCGVCGKATIAALERKGITEVVFDRDPVRADLFPRLPEQLRLRQALFDRTGGLHAAGLFDLEGNLLSLFEDVGRHNALDKLIGNRFLEGTVPIANSILLLSGRTSFELLQKAAVAGIPIVAAVGAPSSLAVEVARHFGITLLGFLAADRFNIYSGAARIATSA